MAKGPRARSRYPQGRLYGGWAMVGYSEFVALQFLLVELRFHPFNHG